MWRPARFVVMTACASVLSLAGCTSGDESVPSSPRGSTAGEATTDDESSAPDPASGATSPPQSGAASPREPGASDDEVEVPRPQSLQAVMARAYRGGPIRVLQETADFGSYTRSEVRYRSDGVRVTGVLHVPAGDGPFPALVLAHGYIEPSSYVTGQGMSREMDYLARAGYVVLHTDYRGHAGSDPARGLERETRLAYTEDVITAVHAVRRLPYVDPERVGLLGRSMGGGVVLNVLVAKPGLVDAAVVYAPVSSRFLDNFNRWTRPERPDVAAEVLARLGTPAERPAVYRGLSARTFFDRISEPLLIHHGTADESCPLRWSRETVRALRAASVDAGLQVYPGEPHAFIADWLLSIRRTDRFFDRHL